MDQVFNELSLSASLPDSYAAHAALLELKKASDKLKALGFSPQIRVTEDFAKYALPLIQGETKLEKEDGLPRFARLKKVFAK